MNVFATPYGQALTDGCQLLGTHFTDEAYDLNTLSDLSSIPYSDCLDDSEFSLFLGNAYVTGLCNSHVMDYCYALSDQAFDKDDLNASNGWDAMASMEEYDADAYAANLI